MSIVKKATLVATKAHKGDVRKGTEIPYITRPKNVGSLLSKAGCPDELIVAGILHDTVEDIDITIDYIRKEFGEKVASIVEGCSEPDKSLPWEERKKHTIEYLKSAPPEIRIVACADKLDNIRSIAADYEKVGDEVWERFKKGRKDQEWYYRGVVESLCDHIEKDVDPFLFEQLRSEVDNFFSKLDKEKVFIAVCDDDSDSPGYSYSAYLVNNTDENIDEVYLETYNSFSDVFEKDLYIQSSMVTKSYGPLPPRSYLLIDMLFNWDFDFSNWYRFLLVKKSGDKRMKFMLESLFPVKHQIRYIPVMNRQGQVSHSY